MRAFWLGGQIMRVFVAWRSDHEEVVAWLSDYEGVAAWWSDHKEVVA